MKHSTFFEGYFSVYLPTTVRGVILFAFSFVIAIFAAFALTPVVHAANGTNNQINYQGKLLDSSGVPVSDGTYSIRFSIYDTASGGNRLWTATGTTASPLALSVSVQNGLFTVLLGDNTTSTGPQNPLDNSINWNSDSLYLGVTIASDSEMSPRKRLSSAPYAFNAERLQGMYASSSIFATSSLFVVNQASNTSATGTRTALEVRSSGTSSNYDFLFRGVNDLSATVFSINRAGSVTTTGNFAFGDGTSDLLTVNGRFNTDLVPSTDLTYSLGTSSLRWNAILGSVTSTNVTTTNLFASTSTITHFNTTNIFGVNATFTNLVATNFSPTNLSVGNVTSINVSTTNLYFTGTLAGGYVSGTVLTRIATVTLDHDESVTALTFSDRHVYTLGSSVEDGNSILRVWDVNNPGVPTTTVTTTAIGTEDITIDGRYLYVNGGTSGMQIYDISSPDTPTIVGTYPESISIKDFHIHGGHLYSGNDIYDVHDPRRIVKVGTIFNAMSFVAETFVQGKVFYQVRSSGSSEIQAYDISDPDRPTLMGSASLPGTPSLIAVQGSYAYIAIGQTIRVFDVGNLGGMYEVASMTGFGSLQRMKVSGRYLYILDSNVFKVIDISNPLAPGIVATNDEAGYADFVITGRFAFLAESGIFDRFHVIDLGGVDVTTLATSFAELGSLQVRKNGRIGNDLFVGGAVNVGPGGLHVDGPFTVNASNTTSTVAGAIAFEQNALVGTSTYVDQLHSLYAMSGDDLFVVGNIGSASSVYTNGAFIAGTGTTMFGDGFIHRTNGALTISATGGVSISGSVTTTNVTTTALFATSFRATSGTITTLAAGSFNANTLTVGGLSSLQTLTFTHATGTGVTSTYGYFSNTVSSTQLFSNTATLGGLVVSGTTICLSNGVGCTGGVESDTLATVSARGATATSTLQLYGGVITASSTVTSTLTATPGTFLPLGMVDLSGAEDVVVSGRYAFVPQEAYALVSIIDIHNPANPSSTATIATASGNVGGVFVVGRYLYVLTEGPTQLRIYDIANPVVPVLVSATAIQAGENIYVSGRYAYVTGAGRFEILDVANPTSPSSVASIVTSTQERVYVSGNLAFFTQGSDGLRIFDVSDPRKPNMLSTYAPPGGVSVYDVKVSGAYAYLTHQSGFDVIDISNPRAPIFKSTIAAANSRMISLAGRYAYVASSGGVSVFDISNPASVSLASFSNATTSVYGIQVVGRYAYLAAQNDFSVFDVGGIQTHAANIGSLFSSSLQVSEDAEIANRLHVGSDLQVGEGGILSFGSLAVAATNSTSTFAGHVSVLGQMTIGTSTFQGALNALFTPSGDDLFVGGNIGSASSVYTNGAFVAGSGSTYFGSGFISNSSATLTISSVSSVSFLTSVEQVISSSTSFTTLSSFAFVSNQGVKEIEVVGKYAYVLTTSSIRILDIGDPRSVSSVGTSQSQGFRQEARNLSVGANTLVFDTPFFGAYSAGNVNYPGEVTLTEVNTGNLPVYSRLSGDSLIQLKVAISGTLYTYLSTPVGNSPPIYGSYPAAMDLEGQIAYVVDSKITAPANSSSLYIIDFRTPNVVTIATSTVISETTSGTHIEVSGRYAYIADSAGTLYVYDVGATSTLRRLTTVTTGFSAGVRDMTITGKYLYVGGVESGVERIKIYDIASPSAPLLVKSFNQANRNFDVVGRYLYVVEDTGNTLQIIDMGGTETNALTAHSASIGDLQIGRDLFVNHTLTVGDSLSVRGDIGVGGQLVSEGVTVSASSAYPVVSLTNSNTTATAWSAYISKLSVGSNTVATGTLHYNMVLTYSSTSRSGICIDDTDTASTCPSRVGYSLIADGPIGASGFDLAERYATTGTIEATDLVSLTSNASATVMRTSGIPYDSKLIGIISSSPGFTLGIHDGEQVALTGRVPAKVSVINGPIRIGDPLTSSIYPGVAMKATKPGMIVGYALDDADTTSTIEVFVKVGYSAGSVLATDGTISEVRDNLVFAASAIASSTSPTADSFGVTFRGSAWNASTSLVSAPSFTLLTDVQSAATSVFAFRNSSGTNVASLTEQGDLSIAGRLFLSARGTPQDQFYLYLDDSLAPTSSYIATNANGFQANSSYDLAERYYSPDNLEPGDLVMIRPEGQIHVQRTSGEEHVVIGIVSTQPGFVLGAHTTSSYPIALAGRVPTKVSTMNGAIKAGDAVGPSSIPGVAVKATSGGPIVGYALEAYEASEVGKVEVFLSAQAALATETEETGPSPVPAPSPDQPGGFAVIQSGATRVHVSYTSIGAYPRVFVTPATEAGDWWTENYTDVGFDIVLAAPLPRDVMFGWEVRPLMAGSQLFFSDNTYQALDPLTGQVVPGEEEEPPSAEGESEGPLSEEPSEDLPTTSTEPTP